MTIQEFATKKAQAEESRRIAKQMMADAEARGDLRKAHRCRLSLIDVDIRLARLAREMGRP